MPVLLPPKPTKKTTQRAAQATLKSSSGVIVYDWNGAGKLKGTFVLALYDGALAEEVGQKIDGNPAELAGIYDITTFTPAKQIFATGRLILVAVGNAGAYDVTFRLNPTPENLTALGYTPGTTLIYRAIGYQLPQKTLFAVAWDNDLYTRTIAPSSEEWGYRAVTSS